MIKVKVNSSGEEFETNLMRLLKDQATAIKVGDIVQIKPDQTLTIIENAGGQHIKTPYLTYILESTFCTALLDKV